MSASSGYDGYWEYPCSSQVNVTLQYGGLAYSISNADMNLGSFTSDSSMCTGAFFEMNLSSASPIDWIVGASFLKNVYSIFRYNPLAIGFAQLSNSAQTVSNGTTVANTTTNNGGTSGTGSGSGGSQSSGALSTAYIGLGAVVFSSIGAIFSTVM